MTDSINGNIGVNNARQYDALNRLTVSTRISEWIMLTMPWNKSQIISDSQILQGSI
jgi:hypothetical protein